MNELDIPHALLVSLHRRPSGRSQVPREILVIVTKKAARKKELYGRALRAAARQEFWNAIAE